MRSTWGNLNPLGFIVLLPDGLTNSNNVSTPVLPQHLQFGPPVDQTPGYETACIIDQLNQQHGWELLQLRDEHRSQIRASKRVDNAHDAALRGPRSRINDFETQLRDLV